MSTRVATVDDVEELVDVQEEAAVPAFGHIFDQDEHPFPRADVVARWTAKVVDDDHDVYVAVDGGVDGGGAVVGFAATRGDELVHFGTALHTWGTGVAQELHDAVLDRMRASGVGKARLWVMAENHRGRRFYEKLGWTDSGARSHSPFEPHPPMWELRKVLVKGA
jgi:RimJ/RimL family protein N-acetyltransferase